MPPLVSIARSHRKRVAVPVVLPPAEERRPYSVFERYFYSDPRLRRVLETTPDRAKLQQAWRRRYHPVIRRMLRRRAYLSRGSGRQRGAMWPMLMQRYRFRPAVAPPLEPDGRSNLYPAVEAFGDTQLAGWLDNAGDYVERKFEEARTKLQTLLGVFMIARERLIRLRELAARAVQLASQDPSVSESQLRQLREIEQRAAMLSEQQHALEGEVEDAARKVRDVSASADAPEVSGDTVGIVPIIIGAGVVAVMGAIAAVAIVSGKVIVHTQAVAAEEKRLALAADGVLTPQAIARLRAGDPTGSGNFLTGVGIGLPLLIGGGALAWILLRRR